jgi:hypothetical protein
MPTAELEHLVGKALPEGTFTISARENRLFSQAVEARADESTAHPALAYVVAQRGIGIQIDALFGLAGFDTDDGPMLGSTQFEFSQPLRVGVRYRVTGEIVAIRRRQGARIGTFDILTVRERLLDADDAVAVVTNEFILTRKEA